MTKNPLLVALAVLFGSTCFANAEITSTKPVMLDLQLELDGKMISHPHASVLPGKTGVITQKLEGQDVSYEIQIRPIMKSAKAVELDFVISRAIGSQTRVLSKPRVIARNNSTASLEQRSKDQPTLKLTVTPTF
jgi:hypothetical protein